MKIEGSPKEIADFLKQMQSQQFKNKVCSLRDVDITVAKTDLQSEGTAQINGFAR